MQTRQEVCSPAITINFNIDLDRVVSTRRKTLDEIVRNGYWMAATHLFLFGKT